jgi:acetylornithine deacetylase ArgE
MSHEFRGTAQGEEVADLLGKMIAIESINPHYPGANQGEGALGAFVLDYLQAMGLTCRTEEVLPGRQNIVGLLEGAGSAGLCLEGHLDTVPVEGMTCEPFTPVIRDGRMYGRGSCDAKGCLAAMLYALKLLVRADVTPATNTYLAAVVDEEYRYRGVTHLLNAGFTVSGAVVGEPTQLKVVRACKGVVRWKLHTRGRAGHSSRPEEGHNAIYDMAEIVQGITQRLIPAYRQRAHPLLGPPTVNVGCISGGTIVNVIPDACVIEIDRRMLPGETWKTVAAEFGPLLDALATDVPYREVTVEEPYLIDEAMETDANQPVVVAAAGACRKILGTSEIQGVSFGCDATKFHRAGIPSVIFGPGNISQAHTVDEFVDLQEVARAAEILAQLCADY